MSFNKFSRRGFSSHAQQVPSNLCLPPPSLQWMWWNKVCAIPFMSMLRPAWLNSPAAETFTACLGYELKHHFLHPVFCGDIRPAKANCKVTMFTCCVNMLVPHVLMFDIGGISGSGSCQEEAFFWHTRRMCVVLMLGACTRVLVHWSFPLLTHLKDS